MNANNKDKKILLIESEEQLRKLLFNELTNFGGFQVEAPSNFNDVIGLIQRQNPDVIVFNPEFNSNDLNGGTPGASFCEKLRFQGNNSWLISVGMKQNINEKIHSLNSGADDHFVKPFSSEELVAKINAMLRRSSSDTRQGTLNYGNLKMDLINRSVWRGEKQVDLRSKEFDLLKVFLLKPEEVLNREFIFDQVWGSSFLGDSNVIEVYIRYLRSKLDKPNLIKTRRGNGYILISDEAQISKSTSSFEL
jgi:two-component system, OmpR family, response regulator MprA